MKLGMVRVAREAHPMVVLGDGRYLDLNIAGSLGLLKAGTPASVLQILDAQQDTQASIRRLIDAVESGSRQELGLLENANALLAAEGATLLPPLQPTLILCTGGSYRDHIKEMGVTPPDAPGAFMKSPRSVTGPRDPILLPVAAPSMIDFECEFCCVFDRPCHNVEEKDALEYIGGFTLINDVSARDAVADWFASLNQNNWRRTHDAWDLNVLGKQYPTFCPLGPFVATKEDIPDPHDVHIKTVLNGQLMQSAHTADLFFSIPKIISYFSRWYTFGPGDVMSTGSPSGVGYARDPKIFMKAGDLVEVAGTGIGSLKNTVTATVG